MTYFRLLELCTFPRKQPWLPSDIQTHTRGLIYTFFFFFLPFLLSFLSLFWRVEGIWRTAVALHHTHTHTHIRIKLLHGHPMKRLKGSEGRHPDISFNAVWVWTISWNQTPRRHILHTKIGTVGVLHTNRHNRAPLDSLLYKATILRSLGRADSQWLVLPFQRVRGRWAQSRA